MSFIADLAKEIKSDFTQIASEIDDREEYINSGCFILNALLCGSIFGGVSSNKITAIAGESSTGKTFFSLAVVQNFLNENPEGGVIYFDTESAITKSLLTERNIDTS